MLAQATAALAFGATSSTITLTMIESLPGLDSSSFQGLLGVLLIFATPLPLGLVLLRSRSQRAMIAAVLAWLVLISVVSVEASSAFFIWNTWAAVPTGFVVLFTARRLRAAGPTMLAGSWLLLLALQLGVVEASMAAVDDLGIQFVDSELAKLPLFDAAERRFENQSGSWLERAESLLADYQQQKLIRLAHPERATLGYAVRLTLRCLLPMAFTSLVVWALFAYQARRYRERRTSDVRLSLDTLYLLFAVTFAILAMHQPDLATRSRIIGAFALSYFVYAMVYSLGLRFFRPPADAPPLGLVLLRTFGRDRRTQELLDSLAFRWRHVGPVQLIGGSDSAHATLAPHDFYDFIAGRLAGRFLRNRGDVERLAATCRATRDPDGLYRIESYYCGDDSWQHAVERLIDQSAAVLMDLRGFTRLNKGCLFELTALIHRQPRGRALLLMDVSTDTVALEDALLAAQGYADPKISATPPAIPIICVDGSTRKTVDAIWPRLLP